MNPTERLTELFTRFPGIGPKQAKRFVYFLLRADKNFKEDLIRTIELLKESGKQCIYCFRFFGEARKYDEEICPICRDTSRDIKKILIVEKELDVDAVEKTAKYDGLYFVLGGLLPLFVEKPTEHIRIREFTLYIQKKIREKTIEEIIFALPVSDTGDTTKEYVEKTTKQIVGIGDVVFSVLARGLSSGLEMEYVDRDTFSSAFDRRN